MRDGGHRVSRPASGHGMGRQLGFLPPVTCDSRAGVQQRKTSQVARQSQPSELESAGDLGLEVHGAFDSIAAETGREDHRCVVAREVADVDSAITSGLPTWNGLNNLIACSVL